MIKPTVSVLMTAYNHGNFVKQAIESVLSQQDVEFEFLITDDGSSDNTAEVIASISDPRIKFFPNKINRGACTAINELITRASGEYIALINSDDYWPDSDKLSYQLQLMKENPMLAASFGRARFVDKTSQPIENTFFLNDIFDKENRSQGAWLRHFFDLGNCLCNPTVLIRKSCYEELGLYSNRLRQLPDFDMWIRVIKKYPIHISDRELICFRVLPGENASSQTIDNTIRATNEHYLIAEHFFDGVSREQMIEGFFDQLVNKEIPTPKHLDIEKTLLYFKENQWLGKPYKMIGLLRINQLLNNSEYHDLLVDEYGINDLWFQTQTGMIDVLRPRVIANLSQKKSFFNEKKSIITHAIFKLVNRFKTV